MREERISFEKFQEMLSDEKHGENVKRLVSKALNVVREIKKRVPKTVVVLAGSIPGGYFHKEDFYASTSMYSSFYDRASHDIDLHLFFFDEESKRKYDLKPRSHSGFGLKHYLWQKGFSKVTIHDDHPVNGVEPYYLKKLEKTGVILYNGLTRKASKQKTKKKKHG